MRNLLAAGLGVLASLSAIAPVDAFYIPGETALPSPSLASPDTHSPAVLTTWIPLPL